MIGESKDEPITLDVSELLGIGQIAKVSDAADGAALGRVLSKIGETIDQPSRLAKLLSKIGEAE